MNKYVRKLNTLPGSKLGTEGSEVDDTSSGINVKTVKKLERLSVNTVGDLRSQTTGGRNNVKTQRSIGDVKITCFLVECYSCWSTTASG